METAEHKAIREFLEALDNMFSVMDEEGGSWQEKAERLKTQAAESDQFTNLEELAGWLEEFVDG